MNHRIHVLYAQDAGDPGLVRQTLAHDLRTIGRAQLGLGQVGKARQAYRASLTTGGAPLGAWRGRSSCPCRVPPGPLRRLAEHRRQRAHSDPMRILYVAMAHEYGRPELGPSFEEMNFRSALEGMGHEVHAFDFRARYDAVGQEQMDRELVALAAEIEPDLAFFFLFEEEIAPATISAVGRAGGCPTMNWFADDHWRFEGFTRHYAPAFDWSITTDRDALPKYRAIGIRASAPQPVGREPLRLRQDRRGARARGHLRRPAPWQPTRGDRRRCTRAATTCSAGAMAGQTAASTTPRWSTSSARAQSTSTSPTPRRRHRTLRCAPGALGSRTLGRRRQGEPRPSQIKGRTFEVPGSGGFLLTERCRTSTSTSTPGRRSASSPDADDLVEQVGYWLEPPRGARCRRGGRLPPGARRAHLRPPLRGDLRRRGPCVTGRR